MKVRCCKASTDYVKVMCNKASTANVKVMCCKDSTAYVKVIILCVNPLVSELYRKIASEKWCRF